MKSIMSSQLQVSGSQSSPWMSDTETDMPGAIQCEYQSWRVQRILCYVKGGLDSKPWWQTVE